MLNKKPEKVVIASGNKKKILELVYLLEPLKIAVVSQSDLGIKDADETGLSFVENAIIKARNACAKSGLPALADDSGLEVDALDGEPGIYSSRYAFRAGLGAVGDDDSNNKVLLQKLNTVKDADRTARFQCVLAYMRHEHDPVPVICQGTWEGKILFAPRGENGFGYDPVFYVPAQSSSAAEFSSADKMQHSHRGKAMQSFFNKMKTLYG